MAGEYFKLAQLQFNAIMGGGSSSSRGGGGGGCAARLGVDEVLTTIVKARNSLERSVGGAVPARGSVAEDLSELYQMEEYLRRG